MTYPLRFVNETHSEPSIFWYLATEPETLWLCGADSIRHPCRRHEPGPRAQQHGGERYATGGSAHLGNMDTFTY